MILFLLHHLFFSPCTPIHTSALQNPSCLLMRPEYECRYDRWENYRTTIDFEKQLAFKLFAFVFVDGFLWYFLLAFLHIPFGSELRALLSLRADGFGQVRMEDQLSKVDSDALRIRHCHLSLLVRRHFGCMHL